MRKILLNQESILHLLLNEWKDKPYANISNLTGLSIEKLHKLTDKANSLSCNLKF